PPLAPSVDEALQNIFGFDDFRPGQRDVVEAVLEGKDTVIVMPTGSGKSLCYQLPACVLEGLTLVVSPLIALMKDQVDALAAFGVPTTFINSSIPYEEQRERLWAMANGQYKIVFIAPERFKNDAFCQAVSRANVGLFAIDEAHCISQWGHDFRPDYLTLGKARKMLGEPTTLALTATATPDVQKDIARQLELDKAEIVVSGFERPNLFFEVFMARRKDDKIRRLKALLDHYENQSAVIYCATRKQVEEVYSDLRAEKYDVGMYHAGLSDADREDIQDAFMSGDVPILVATNAFGMGVDKSDVRAIVHYNIPGSIEAYYQEAGRAGRDGEPAHCLLLFNAMDKGIHEFFIENSSPEPKTVERVWEHLSKYGVGTHALGAEQVTDHLNRAGRANRLHSWGVESVLRLLQRGGHVDWGVRDGRPWIALLDQAHTRNLRVDWEAIKARRELDERHLLDTLRYASGHGCRQHFLLRYFSSRLSNNEQRCGHCDTCSGRPAYAAKNRGPARPTVSCPEPHDLVLRKVLSGVARTRGRFGAHLVASMLRGSGAKKVKSTGLDRLSTFGIVSYLRQQDLVDILDWCLANRLTTQNIHGAISLTDEGIAVMKTETPIPQGVQENMERRFRVGEPPPRATSTSSPGTTSSSAGSGDTYLTTLEFLREGLSYKEIADRRGLSPQSILRHVMVLADQGHTLDLSDALDGRILPMLRELAEDWKMGDPLAPLKEALPDSCNYATLKLNLAHILMERRA
ncbi:MAG: RecQ family ATP-dependent DNA helicase, partial [Bradymonadaceae bacterium]